jgi:hypothetical protein
VSSDNNDSGQDGDGMRDFQRSGPAEGNMDRPSLPWRTHAMFAALANGGLTGLWALTRDPNPGPGDEGAGYWWPLWIGLLWGLAVLLHYLRAARRLGRRQWRVPTRCSRQ